MTLQDNKDLAERYHREIYEKGDSDAADFLLTPDFVMWGNDAPAGGGRGPAFIKEDARIYRAAFTIDLEHNTVVAEGDYVTIRWTFRGVHQGPLGDLAATGRGVEVGGIDLYRISNGKIAELWQWWDQPGLMAQLGA
jgi:predicted ester cyclase